MTVAWPSDHKIQLNDLFWTLQGEGRWTGHRALFVRFPFCNYDCPWCDTEFNSYKKWRHQDFVEFARQEPARFAVLTGGEPIAHKDLPLVIQTLKSLGFTIACESNGSLPIPPEIDFPTLSPKPYSKGKFPPYYIDETNLARAKEFKYVVDDKFTFDILDRHKPYDTETIYSLSPEFSQMSTAVPRIIEYIKLNPQWKLSLQTHKWIDIP